MAEYSVSQDRIYRARIGSIDLRLNRTGLDILRSKDQRDSLRQFLQSRSLLLALLHFLQGRKPKHEFMGCGRFSTVFAVGEGKLAIKQVNRYRGKETIKSIYQRNLSLYHSSQNANVGFDAPEIYGYLTYAIGKKLIHFLLLEHLQAFSAEDWAQIIERKKLEEVKEIIHTTKIRFTQFSHPVLNHSDHYPSNFLYGRRKGEDPSQNRGFVIDQ